MRQFNSIWNRAYHGSTPAEKLADDLGKITGRVKITEYDPITKAILSVREEPNTVMNQAKTVLIQLISQGQDRWLGAINPTNLKISKMRFSNNNSSGTPNRLLYYDLSEPSARPCVPVVSDTHAGGGNSATLPADPLSSILYSVGNVSGNYVVGPTSNIKIFTVKTATLNGQNLTDHAPSHGTYKIDLLYQGTIMETLYFYNPSNPATSLYFRSGVAPYEVITIGTDTSKVITTPQARTSQGGNLIAVIPSPANTNTLLYYDYNDGAWKLQLEEVSGRGSLYDTLRMTYYRGSYNVINSIIPPVSYNLGTGNTLSLRYPQATQGDAYPILSSLEYQDGSLDFVDDFSVTFGCNMIPGYGNGVIPDNSASIYYVECFLFNALDNLFSTLFLSSPVLKNPTNAYFFSWILSSPIG